ncbi:MAG: hypothetical protein K0R91_290 [Nitrososphaeraceae archaeon]|jgi:hypothetical protein|nr:hypothetical protein [Nitrososphaeraceae archaeon]
MLDLESINSPEEYRVLFITYDTFMKNDEVYCEFFVEEPLGVLDYINIALNAWGAPVKEFFAIVTTVGGAGISGWVINKARRNKKKKDQTNTNNHNVKGSTSPNETQ